MKNFNLVQLSEQSNVSITISASELFDAINYCVSVTRKELEQQITDANTETYLSPEKVAQILDVHPTTLWRWNKSGYLKHIELGGKRRYRMSDINNLLNVRQ